MVRELAAATNGEATPPHPLDDQAFLCCLAARDRLLVTGLVEDPMLIEWESHRGERAMRIEPLPAACAAAALVVTREETVPVRHRGRG